MIEFVHRWVRAETERRNALIEQAIECAITDACAPGILVHEDGLDFRVEVTTAVPYGYIHWHRPNHEECMACQSTMGSA